MILDKDARVYVAGHRGLVGSAVVRALQRQGYGNLLLSRWPLHQHHHVSLRLHRRKPRGAQLAIVDTPEGPIHLVNWHLALAEKERRWQADHLLTHALFRESSHLPTLIVGDTNGRYFEPSATRNFLVGVSAYATF